MDRAKLRERVAAMRAEQAAHAPPAGAAAEGWTEEQMHFWECSLDAGILADIYRECAVPNGFARPFGILISYKEAQQMAEQLDMRAEQFWGAFRGQIG